MMPIRNGLKNIDVPAKTSVNNAVHQKCIKNIDIMNYYPQNNMNTNANIVVLPILIKHLSSMKPMKENVLEVKNKLQE